MEPGTIFLIVAVLMIAWFLYAAIALAPLQAEIYNDMSRYRAPVRRSRIRMVIVKW